jgi:hypothetical protein
MNEIAVRAHGFEFSHCITDLDRADLPVNATIFPKSPPASVRPHNPNNSNGGDGKPTATVRGEKFGRYKNCILAGCLR